MKQPLSDPAPMVDLEQGASERMGSLMGKRGELNERRSLARKNKKLREI